MVLKRRSPANGQTAVILRGITANFPPSTITAVLGPSGAGKSSLLRLLNRLEDPSSGTILFQGKNLAAYPVREIRRRIGMVFQLPALFPGTVGDNLVYGPALRGEKPDEAELETLLRRVDLPGDLLRRPSRDLSVGQQQRVAIARALANRPEVLLMDEPTSALDPAAAGHILNLLAELKRDLGLTFIFVTHLPQQAAAADRVLFIADGEKVFEGSAASFFASDDPRIAWFLAAGSPGPNAEPGAAVL